PVPGRGEPPCRGLRRRVAARRTEKGRVARGAEEEVRNALMTQAVDFPAGNYRFVPGVFQYSGGAAANDGYAIERVRFHEPVPLKEGFARIEKIIRDAGRPLTSFCACELRSPAPFTEDGFRAFNQIYVVTLKDWGLFDGTVNPVARSN